ncbi:CRTAC1 family protein [Haloparvum sedimenti]|uniref:CRTAC1 family protein n=1 Tax=Haloparvum sedimenti TaxID=1678448 RepID=UPI00071E6CCE|nr:CRTAC1 family protein [Haloparvum sedimenti]
MLRAVPNLLEDAAPVRGRGVAVTPGRDGPLVFVGGDGEPNRLYAREGDAYVDTATGIVADPDRHATCVVAADLDADGCEELYVHNADVDAGHTPETDLLLDRLERDRYRWTDAFALPVNRDRRNHRVGRAVAAVDRYGTGRYGVVVGCTDSPTRFYEVGDDGEVTDLAAAVGIEVEADVRSVVAAPVLTDGMDLFVGAADGGNRLLCNDSGHFADAAGPSPANGAPVRAATLVDEGDALALVAATETGLERYRPDGEGGLDSVPTPAFEGVTDVRSLTTADLDNDGREELFCATASGSNKLFARRGEPADEGSRDWGRVDAGDAEAPARSAGATAVADLDDDGGVELLVLCDETARPPALFECPVASERDWLRVRPTTQYDAPARGAVVRLRTTAGVQRRVVEAGCGSPGGSEPVAHFGLDGATPERLIVRWPDGREQAIEDPEPNVEHGVDHPVAPRF